MATEMNLTDKLLNPEVLDRISKVDWSGQSEYGPYVVELDPTAACDLACPGCISEDIIAEGGRFSNQRLLEFPSEFSEAGVRAVILIGGGEPLTHPKIGEFMVRCAENDIRVGLTTNGTLIDRHLSEIGEICDWTRVSMDAGSQLMFDKLRPSKSGRSMFAKVVENIVELARIKKGILGYSYLLQSPADGEAVVDNIEDMVSAASLAKEIGCDYFEIKPTYAWRGDVPHALVVHNTDYLERAREKIFELDGLESSDFRILHAINLKHSLAGVQALQLKEYEVCPSAQLRTLVTPKGVFVCPYWRGKSRFSLGDVKDQGFGEVWRSEEKRNAMKALNPREDCKFHCLRHETNVAAFDLKLRMEKLQNFDGVSISENPEWDRFI